LVTAAGTKLYAIDIPSGKVSWKLHEVVEKSAANDSDGNGQEPSGKRRKVENDGTTNGTDANSRRSSEDSVNFKVERVKGERKKTKVETVPPPPSISHVLTAGQGRYLIVLTAEDKAICVYDLEKPDSPTLESRRNMPKRLCAATLTPDERHLIVGDKFGDVYELPLHPTEGWVPPKRKAEKFFEPSASELTVHTRGNLQALKQQKEQKMKAIEKEGLGFEHRMLLGHVSLLTDVQMATSEVNGRQRTYVLTADRDEHVRVSRYPQSHIIEGYCLGIREFVSRSCVLPWASNLVAVGTGEPSLRIYEWLSGRLLSMDGFEHLQERLSALSPSKEDQVSDKIAVFGIWPVAQAQSEQASNQEGRLLVALEG
jgi:tRNA (guanine-N(7)-)-methyltransferase subunit TRM82